MIIDVYLPQHRHIEIWTPVNCMAHTTSITRSQKTCKEARNSCTSNRPSIDCLICAVFIQQWYKGSNCHRAHIFSKIPSWQAWELPLIPIFLAFLGDGVLVAWTSQPLHCWIALERLHFALRHCSKGPCDEANRRFYLWKLEDLSQEPRFPGDLHQLRSHSSESSSPEHFETSGS